MVHLNYLCLETLTNMHGSATTSPELRSAIQKSPESIRTLAHRHGINPKTVAKWKNRSFTDDLPMGPRTPAAPALSSAEEAMCVAFRKHAMLPLDDCLYALQLKLPHLTRSTLHRLFQRHDVSRLPETAHLPDKIFRGADRRPGDFYVDTSEVRTGDGKITMFVAFDQASTFAYARLYENIDRHTAADFLMSLTNAMPHHVRSVLTSNTASFTGYRDKGPSHPFSDMCERLGVSHKLAPPDHDWLIDQRATPKRQRQAIPPGRPPYESHAHLREHYLGFFDSYNFSRRLKTLNGLTPYQFICRWWREDPECFRVSPLDQTPRLTENVA